MPTLLHVLYWFHSVSISTGMCLDLALSLCRFMLVESSTTVHLALLQAVVISLSTVGAKLRTEQCEEELRQQKTASQLRQSDKKMSPSWWPWLIFFIIFIYRIGHLSSDFFHNEVSICVLRSKYILLLFLINAEILFEENKLFNV